MVEFRLCEILHIHTFTLENTYFEGVFASPTKVLDKTMVSCIIECELEPGRKNMGTLLSSIFVAVVVGWVFIGPLLIKGPADYPTAIACSVQHPFMNNAQLLKACPDILKK